MTALERLRTYLAERDDAERHVGAEMRSQVLGAGTERVFVLLHGLTASPPSWNAIAQRLAAQGATVIVPRLPLHGHGDRLSPALGALSTAGLTADLRALMAHVEALRAPVTLAGQSLGGTLAMHAAATLPGIDRAVAIAPFLGIARFPFQSHGVLVPLLRVLPNAFLWWDPVLRERQLPAHGYPRYPLHSLAVGISIAETVYADAGRPPRARTIDLVVNDRETSVNNRAVERLAQRWRGADAALAVHRLQGLEPSHDIIEPARPMAERARAALLAILSGNYPPGDHVHAV